MNHFDLKNFAIVLAKLETVEGQLGFPSRKTPELKIDQKTVDIATEVLQSILDFCKANMESPTSKTSMFENGYLATDTALRSTKPSLTVSALMVYLQTVRHGLFRDIVEHNFLYVPKDRMDFLKPDIFGLVVAKRFQKAKNDIRSFGECLAADCSTAAVFHLMRIVEHGLRAVAIKLKVKLTHKGANQPIEFADWNQVITGIKNKIAEIRKLIPSGKRRDQNLQFYSDVADQCDYMKDIWRNTISHTRKPYNSAEAVAIFTRVYDFMQENCR